MKHNESLKYILLSSMACFSISKANQLPDSSSCKKQYSQYVRSNETEVLNLDLIQGDSIHIRFDRIDRVKWKFKEQFDINVKKVSKQNIDSISKERKINFKIETIYPKTEFYIGFVSSRVLMLTSNYKDNGCNGEVYILIERENGSSQYGPMVYK